MLLLAQVLVDFGMSKKVYFVKNAFCVFVRNVTNRWDFM